MRTLTNRENKILVVCLILILGFIGYRGVFKSFQEKDADLDARIQSLELLLKKNLEVLGREEHLNQAYEDFSQGKKQTRSKEQEMTMILSQIESIAKEMNMQVSDMKPQKVKESQFFNQFTVSLALEGELIPILHFIYLLEDQPHNFIIDEMRIERSFGRTAGIRCRLKISRILLL